MARADMCVRMCASRIWSMECACVPHAGPQDCAVVQTDFKTLNDHGSAQREHTGAPRVHLAREPGHRVPWVHDCNKRACMDHVHICVVVILVVWAPRHSRHSGQGVDPGSVGIPGKAFSLFGC
eukprot:1148729-Pelagomonas_calceolata.AAC.3